VRVRKDPRVTDTSDADLDAQYALALRAAAAMNEAADALRRIGTRKGAVADSLRADLAAANGDFATILGSVESGDAAPTPAQIATFARARRAFDATLARVRAATSS
jgi:hypothetical protein